MKTQTAPTGERKHYKYTRRATPEQIAECEREGTPAPAGKQSPNGLAVHPAADIFPMLSADELQELAADIAENGLKVPIVLDHTGKVLVDGRNRLKACEIAQVEPQFETLPEGADPVPVIVGMNINRWHLTKGQKGKILAMIYPELERRNLTDQQAAMLAMMYPEPEKDGLPEEEDS
jgi:hypothetical protein